MSLGADITSIFALMIGVATIAVVVQNPQGTIGAIGATTQGFALDLGTAMGNRSGSGGGGATPSFGVIP